MYAWNHQGDDLDAYDLKPPKLRFPMRHISNGNIYSERSARETFENPSILKAATWKHRQTTKESSLRTTAITQSDFFLRGQPRSGRCDSRCSGRRGFQARFLPNQSSASVIPDRGNETRTRRVGGLRNVQLHEAEKRAALINGRHGAVQVNAIAARIYNASVEYPTMFLGYPTRGAEERRSGGRQEKRGARER
ncbi:hypothetical protein K0M31_004905 [Melipona bicolor]|uniref:Uncharacterized protein n=1 Tax=Melipona bicolor TaxID=60889 RepID=A0AA40FWG3_9HYME|nr:hypothetical protein K0M31_004905 [Melipona bicolor]